LKKLLFILLAFISLSASAQVITTIGTENKGKHVKFFIAGDGFTSSQQSTFNSEALRIANLIKATAPYSDNLDQINFYRVNTISVQSGVSIAASPPGGNGQAAVNKDTYFDVYRNDGDLYYAHNMLGANRLAVETLLGNKSGGERVFLIIVSNHTGYGGVGEFKSHTLLADGSLDDVAKVGVMITSMYNLYNYEDFLPLHEFSHTFGQLGDEYYYSDADYQDLISTPRGLHLVQEGAKAGNIRTSAATGWVKGANYSDDFYWRPGDDKMMYGAWKNGSEIYTEYSAHNEALVQIEIDKNSVSIIDGISFSMSSGSATTAAGVQNYSTTVTRYYAQGGGCVGQPCTGAIMYTKSTGTLFNGQNRWWKASNNKAYKIDTEGKILQVSALATIKQFQMSGSNSSSSSGACSLYLNNGKWYIGTNSIPGVGDRIYANSACTLTFTGYNKWWRLASGVVVKVDYSGYVTSISTCY